MKVYVVRHEHMFEDVSVPIGVFTDLLAALKLADNLDHDNIMEYDTEMLADLALRGKYPYNVNMDRDCNILHEGTGDAFPENKCEMFVSGLYGSGKDEKKIGLRYVTWVKLRKYAIRQAEYVVGQLIRHGHWPTNEELAHGIEEYEKKYESSLGNYISDVTRNANYFLEQHYNRHLPIPRIIKVRGAR